MATEDLYKIETPKHLEWMGVIQNLYGKDRDDEYTEEKEAILKIISKLEDYLKPGYQLVKPFDVGGTGILFLVQETKSKKLRAIKFSRPLSEAHKSAELIKDEGDKLICLVHPNIIAVHEVDVLEYSEKYKVAYFVMDYIEDAMDLKKKILFEIFKEKISVDKSNILQTKNQLQDKNPAISASISESPYLSYAGMLHFIILISRIKMEIQELSFK